MNINEEQQDKFSAEYYASVSERLKAQINKSKLNQEEIAGRCKKVGLNMTQGMISKILNYKDNPGKKKPPAISLAHAAGICNALNIPLDAVLSIKGQTFESSLQESIGNKNSFVINPNDEEFGCYIGKFICYYHSTLAKYVNTENAFLRAELTFSPDEEKQICGAEFLLETNTPNKKVEKYTGQLVISKLQHACYCILTNNELGEIIMLNFDHNRQRAGEKLPCIVAAVLTTSEGTEKRPTSQRMFIGSEDVKAMFKKDDFKIFMAQMLLNRADILIKKDDLPKDLPQEIAKLFAKEGGKGVIPVTEYYSFRESTINKKTEMGDFERMKAICKLRQASLAPRYNKVASEANQITFDFWGNYIADSQPAETDIDA
jgi:transcriptional regulator with XRE-family HTH domain